MARDYKHRATPSKKSKPIAGWWWLVTGLLIGGFIMFLMNLQESMQSSGSTQTSIPTPVQDVRAVKKVAPVSTKKNIAANKPRFDFYTILPEMEVVIPDREIEERRRLEGTGKSKTGLFIIQMGSFRKASQADTLKARLALIGIESKVDIVKSKGSTWHRVKSGPHTKFSQVDRIQSRLHRHHIDSIVIELHP